MRNFNIPTAIYLHNECVKGVAFSQLKSFINKNFGKTPVRIVSPKKAIVCTNGILLDLLKTNQSFSQSFPGESQICRIIITDKIFATYDTDKSLHIRAAVYGFPSIISTSGIVEGPAKPREYYIYKEKLSRLGAWEMEGLKVRKKFKSRFIDYDDKRINEALKGYISQALFFYITADPFCTKKTCRLFNAHWQEDLIYSQITIGRFCPRHRRILNLLRI